MDSTEEKINQLLQNPRNMGDIAQAFGMILQLLREMKSENNRKSFESQGLLSTKDAASAIAQIIQTIKKMQGDFDDKITAVNKNIIMVDARHDGNHKELTQSIKELPDTISSSMEEKMEKMRGAIMQDVGDMIPETQEQNEIPDDFDEIVTKKVLKKIPIDRFSTIDEVMKAIQTRLDRMEAAGMMVSMGGDIAAPFEQQLLAGTNISIKKKGNGYQISSTASGGGVTYEAPVGTVDDSNTSFTVKHEPTYINVNGAIYHVGNGAYSSYDSLTGTITLAYPVGTGGFIESYY